MPRSTEAVLVGLLFFPFTLLPVCTLTCTGATCDWDLSTVLVHVGVHFNTCENYPKPIIWIIVMFDVDLSQTLTHMTGFGFINYCNSFYPSPPGTNSCSNNNGECAHLCLPYPGGRTCACGRGFYSLNATSCAPLPDCPAGEQSCYDASECVSSDRFCDGHVDCEDQSDEQDCEFTAKWRWD